MIGTHKLHLANADMIPGVVPDRQQYDRHTPITSCKRRYDTSTWCKYFILPVLNRSFDEYSTTSRQPSISADYEYVFILKRSKLCNIFIKSNKHDIGNYDTLYFVLGRQQTCSSDVMIYWTMTGTHVAPDCSTMGTHQLHLAWFTYNCCTESYTPPPVGLTPIPHLLPYM